MYKIKPCLPCDMPAPDMPLRVLVLNASLKHENQGISNTGELADLVISNLKEQNPNVQAESIRLADKDIPVGLGYRESDTDEWPMIAEKIKAADILLFATPVWWGQRSSLMQRVIERMDAIDEDYRKSGKSALYNKIAGIVITGNEDGALHVMGSIMMALSWLGLSFPPECCAYWVGEVGNPISGDRELRLRNTATQHMAKNLARNLLFYSELLKQHPLAVKSA